jgi:hypothetical protein
MDSRPLPPPLHHPVASRSIGKPGWREILTWILLLFALWRGLVIVTHTPLIALANNYDQVRYTACLDLYPVRPGIAPAQLNYQAPLDIYAFQKVSGQDCYFTSDLIFQGATASIFRISEVLGGSTEHSVRVLGGLRFAAWLLVVVLLCAAFRRVGRSDLAVANAAWLASLGLDPVNSVFLNGFYAEAGAAFFAYCMTALLVLNAMRSTWQRLLLLGLATIALGTAKIQHAALPLFIALAVTVVALTRERRLWPAVGLLMLCAVATLAVQSWQMGRADAMSESIRQANNIDFVLTALLPSSDDAARTAASVGIDPLCANSSGRSIYTLGTPPEQACPGISELSRARSVKLLLSEPATVLRMLGRVPAEMLPWIPSYLGLVESKTVAPLPDEFVSVNRLFDRRSALAWIALLSPLIIGGWLLFQRNASAVSRVFSAVTATISITVPIVSVYGDGLAEIAKHSHLALNAGCGFLMAGAVSLACRNGHRHVT